MEDLTQAREIPLSQGKVALVDDEDYTYLSQWKWHAHRSAAGIWYARRAGMTTTVPSGWTTALLHNVIMQPTAGYEIDHEDGDGLNNQRSNLRIATHTQNMANKRLTCNNTSGYKGVSLVRKSGKWKAQINIDGKRTYLGVFDDPVAAARAYDEAATEQFGEFAYLNFDLVGS